jgi:hypothetical protein
MYVHNKILFHLKTKQKENVSFVMLMNLENPVVRGMQQAP